VSGGTGHCEAEEREAGADNDAGVRLGYEGRTYGTEWSIEALCLCSSALGLLQEPYETYNVFLHLSFLALSGETCPV